MNSGLTTFRWFAFFAVFLGHAYILGSGYLGVQAFFVLSGFLLTDILVKMKETHQGKSYFRIFYGRRMLRIFPLYYGYLLLVALVTLPMFYPDGGSGYERVDRFYQQLPWAITYTYNFFHASLWYEHTHLLVHFWSLAVEEQFYLLWPVIIYFLPGKYLKNFLVLVILLGPVLRWFTGYLFDNELISFLGKQKELVIYVLPFSHIDAFAIGGFFALYRKGGSMKNLFIFFIAVVLLGLLSSWLSDGSLHLNALGYSNFMALGYQYVWGYTLVNVFFATILVAIKEDRFFPNKGQKSRLRYLGEISYGLYVFHYPCLWLVYTCMPDHVPGVLTIVVALILTILLSIVSYELYEKKFIALKAVYFNRNNQQTR